MTETIKKIVEIPRADLETFEKMHPQHGAWTWFVREALSRYIALHKEETYEAIDEAVRDIQFRKEA